MFEYKKFLTNEGIGYSCVKHPAVNVIVEINGKKNIAWWFKFLRKRNILNKENEMELMNEYSKWINDCNENFEIINNKEI